jgi:hypothetical protein
MSTSPPIEKKDVDLLPIRKTPVLPLRPNSSLSIEQVEKISNTPLPTNRGLTTKEMTFIEFFLQGKSLKEAKTLAGFKESVTGTDVYRRPRIFQEIQKRARVHFEKMQLTTEDVLNRVSACAHSNPLDYYDILPDGNFQLNLNNMPSREAAEAIQELYYDAAGRPRITFVPKAAYVALETRLKGMLSDNRFESDGKDGSPSTIQAFDQIIMNTTINVQNVRVVSPDREKLEDKHPVLEGKILVDDTQSQKGS